MSTASSETLKMITNVFHAIGSTEGTKFSDLTDRESVAHEYIVAKTLCRLAVKRLELAEKLAVKQKIIGDPDKLVTGQEVTVWRCKKTPPSLIITARTSNERQPIIDRTLLFEELSRRYLARVVDDIIAKSSKPVAPMVTYSVVFF